MCIRDRTRNRSDVASPISQTSAGAPLVRCCSARTTPSRPTVATSRRDGATFHPLSVVRTPARLSLGAPATNQRLPALPSSDRPLRTLIGNSSFDRSGPNELVGVDARSGLSLDGNAGSRWFVAGAPKESLAGVRTTLSGWKVAPSRLEVATVGLLGVVRAEQQRTKGAPALVWEIGEATSDLFLVSAQGLENVKRLPFGLDRVADSVQAELNLKFRGAATKLFLGEFYNFSEIGPEIAGRVAGSLQPAIAEITGSGGAPAT